MKLCSTVVRLPTRHTTFLGRSLGDENRRKSFWRCSRFHRNTRFHTNNSSKYCIAAREILDWSNCVLHAVKGGQKPSSAYFSRWLVEIFGFLSLFVYIPWSLFCAIIYVFLKIGLQISFK